MKFYVVTDATGRPAVMGEERLRIALDNDVEHHLDVSGAYDSYELAIEAVTHMHEARRANVPA